ncbi:hypothetical protein C8R47DRAFT_1327090 [Mycena vitilis]|nr:hypothetical protein C8R47DRAFT_1327090 [Mycena vitilis]
MSAPNLVAEYLLGPWLIGTSLELVLQGILFAQFVKYFGQFHDDPLGLRALVAGLALMTTVISVLQFALLWEEFAVHFGTILRYQTSLTTGNGVIRAIAGLYVQCYFCSRLYLLSKKWYIVAPMVAIFIAAFVTSVIAADAFRYKGEAQILRVPKWYTIYLPFPLTMAGDILLTSTTAYFLIRCRKDVLPASVGVLNALIRLTFQTAAPATVCALIGFIFSLAFPNVVPHARVVGTLAANVILPKLYAFSMMWTLNAREHIRAELNASSGGNISASNTAQNAQRTVVHDPELGTSEGKASAEFCAPQKSKLRLGRAAAKRADVVEDADDSGDEVVFAPPRKSSVGMSTCSES